MPNWSESEIKETNKDVIAGRADKLEAVMEKAGSCMMDELTDALNKQDSRGSGYRHEIAKLESGKEIHTMRYSSGYYNAIPVVSLPFDKCKK